MGSSTMSTTSKKGRELDEDKIYDLLLGARTADVMTVHFKDGRVIRGALIFNQYKGTARLINIEKEVSIDFNIDEVRDLRS